MQAVWTLRPLTQRYAQFWLFRKWPENSFVTTFHLSISRKSVFHVTFYYLTTFHWLIAPTSWDIGQVNKPIRYLKSPTLPAIEIFSLSHTIILLCTIMIILPPSEFESSRVNCSSVLLITDHSHITSA